MQLAFWQRLNRITILVCLTHVQSGDGHNAGTTAVGKMRTCGRASTGKTRTIFAYQVRILPTCHALLKFV